MHPQPVDQKAAFIPSEPAESQSPYPGKSKSEKSFFHLTQPSTLFRRSPRLPLNLITFLNKILPQNTQRVRRPSNNHTISIMPKIQNQRSRLCILLPRNTLHPLKQIRHNLLIHVHARGRTAGAHGVRACACGRRDVV